MPVFQQKMTWRGGYVTSELISSGDAVRPQVSSSERETHRYNVEMATKVGDNEIISKINQTAEQIQIQASKVNLTGYITATNLATPGQTVINGGNITTGTIDASDVNVTNINASNIISGELSANRISGGTLIVGGQNNANGTIVVKDASGNTTGTIDNTGANIYGSLSSSATVGGVSFATQINGANIRIMNGALPMFTVVPKGDGTSDGRVSMRGSNATLYLTGSDLIYSARKNGNPFTAVSMGVSGTDPNSYGGLYLAGPSVDGSRIQSIDLNPSGVSRFGSSLGGGDVEINGVLDVTQRRCYGTLSSYGWYKVCTLRFGNDTTVIGGIGFAIDLCITTTFNNSQNDTHFVSLLVAYQRYYFVDEKSVSRSVCIDKIRYVNDGNGNGHIDIHYAPSVNNLVVIDFIPHISPDFQQYIVAESLQAVANSPSGTVLKEYTFSENTITDISSSFALNTSGISGLTGKIHAIYDSSSGLVHLNFSAYTASATFGTSTPIFTCSNSRYMPTSTTNGNGMIRMNNGEWYPYEVSIGTTGNIFQGLTGTATRVYGQITYPV
jgi:hypothetical protein